VQYSLFSCEDIIFPIFVLTRAPPTSNYPLIKQQVEQQFENVTTPSDWSSNYKTYIDQNYVAVQVIKSTYNVEDYKQQPGELEPQFFLYLFSILGETIGELISAIGGQEVL
jgi:hypothetical protein